MISLIVIIVVSYLLGSIPASIIAGKLFRGIDIREHGSGNAGGTNAFRVMGWKIGLGVSLFDIVKGTVATVLVSKITIDTIPFDNHTVVMILAGLGAILGHTYTIFGGFHGGKGVATGAGMIIGLYPLAFVLCLLVFAIVLFSSGLVSLSSMVAATSLPIILYLMKITGNQIDIAALLFSVLIPLFIIYTHRSNVRRLINGEEKPFEKLMIFKKEKSVSFSDHILYEDNHLLVVNKPANLLVQGDVTGDETLLDQAKYYLKEKYNKPGNVYLGLVHRLDRPASGVIVLARTSKAADRLSKQFQSGKTKKVYRIIVQKKPPKFGEWKDYIQRNGATSLISDESQGKLASLDFSRLKTSPEFSLVEVRLHTGRHHQIRIQFASRKFPVLGDFRYGSKEKFPDRAIALHAFSLTLIHPTTKEAMTFTAGLPLSWSDFLADMT